MEGDMGVYLGSGDVSMFQEDEEDMATTYLAGASDVDAENDEKECEVWMAARKSHRAMSRFRKSGPKKHSFKKYSGPYKGMRGKGPSKGYRFPQAKGFPSWLPPPGKGFSKGKGKGKGGKKGKHSLSMSSPPWAKGKSFGKGKKGNR